MVIDPRDDIRLIAVGLRHAAESIRTAVIGSPARGAGRAGVALCAELYACAGRFESHVRDLAAIEECNASHLRAIPVAGEARHEDGASTGESLVTFPDVGTYVLPIDVPIGERVALLEQAAGIVETITDVLDTTDSHRHVRSLLEEIGLVQLSEQVSDFAKVAADLWESD